MINSMTDWVYRKLGEVATFSRGLTYTKGDVADISSKKVLRSNNIEVSNNSLNFNDVACLKEEFVIPDEKKLHKGDIFICMSNGSTQHLGKVAFIEDDIDYAFGGFMGAIHPNQKETDPKFVFYACLSQEYRRYLASVLNGININNLKWSDLSKFPIPVPPLSTQSRIVSKLDLLQSIIDKQKAQLKEYDTLAQSIFYDMFGDPVENEKGWEVKKFDELCAIITDGEHATPRRSESGVYLLSARNIQNHKLDLKDVDYIDTEEYNHIAKRITPQKGDVLISCSGSVGRVCIAPDIKFQMVRSVALLRLIDSVCSVFFEYLICSDYVQNQINNSKVQVAQANLFQGKIRALNAIVPPLSLQQTFAAKIESIEKQKAAISKSIAETEKLFDYTMDKYFG